MELPGCGAWAGCVAWGDAVWERDVEFSGCVAWGDAVWERDGAWGAVEAPVEDAGAVFEAATCDCAGAVFKPLTCDWAVLQETGVCRMSFPIMSALPTQRQAAVVPVQKKPTHSEHPKT